jgi:hypothetical protein
MSARMEAIGSIGGHARAKALTAERRSEIASKAAIAKWGTAPRPVKQSKNQKILHLRWALQVARKEMLHCQSNVHQGSMCFDGDHWHEMLGAIDSVLKATA